MINHISYILGFVLLSLHAIAQETDEKIQYTDDIDWNIILAAYNNDTTKIFEFLDNGADVNTETSDGITALMYAVENNSLYSTRLLVANGASIDKVPYVGYPALTSACLNGNFEIAEYLIQKGADKNIKDINDDPILILVCKNNDFYMADMLLYYRANVDAKDYSGRTALYFAIQQKNVELINLLLLKKANPNIKDRKGNTPLMLAASLNDTSILASLLRKKADVNIKNDEGYDALSFAVKNNNIEVIKLLVDAEANVLREYDKNLNSATLSFIYGNQQVTKYLKENGSKVYYRPSFKNFGFEIDFPFNIDDYYIGTNISFSDQKYNLTLESGFRFRPTAIRTLERIDDFNYFQYWERKYILYTGLKQNQDLFNINSEKGIKLDYGINIVYHWGSYRGSGLKPDNKFAIMPNASIFFHYSFFETGLGYEYLDLNTLKRSSHFMNVFVRFNFKNKYERQFNNLI